MTYPIGRGDTDVIRSDTDVSRYGEIVTDAMGKREPSPLAGPTLHHDVKTQKLRDPQPVPRVAVKRAASMVASDRSGHLGNGLGAGWRSTRQAHRQPPDAGAYVAITADSKGPTMRTCAATAPRARRHPAPAFCSHVPFSTLTGVAAPIAHLCASVAATANKIHCAPLARPRRAGAARESRR